MRAQGEVIIRDALRELDMWGAGSVFQLTEYEDSHKAKVMLIKEWKELVTQVGFCFSLYQFLLCNFCDFAGTYYVLAIIDDVLLLTMVFRCYHEREMDV